ncbi:MAG: NAD(+)/NADH kinase [Actinomycetota bacterium]|nr:NAD(+)/NADH kinase [Actinomycetota bacterium]
MPSVSRIAVIAHGQADVADAVERVKRLAQERGIDVVEDSPDLAVVLGGDGTMLRTLKRFLGAAVPVIGVNYGRVGFLASMGKDDLEEGLARAFAGEFETVELPTLEVELGGERHPAVNDVVAHSGVLGRMVELSWAVAGEDLGTVPCDGLICSTPSGSTAYNLSGGGPVLVWGLDAMAVTFVAPHSLHVRPLVVPRSRELKVTNLTSGVEVALIADGQQVGSMAEGDSIRVGLTDRASLLATLPESTFFRRYRETFAH